MEYKNEMEYYQDIYNNQILGQPREKPVVHFFSLDVPVVVGERAIVKVIDHPASYLNDAPFIYTSGVVAIDPGTGDFETLNTKYVKVEKG